MTAPTIQAGAGTGFVPELLVREVLIEGLALLVSDEYRLDELVRRVDSLVGNTSDDWQRELRLELQRLILESDHGLPVIIGHPDDDSHLPAISVVLATTSGNDSEARAADIVDVQYERVGSDDTFGGVGGTVRTDGTGVVYRHDVLGEGQTTQLQVGTWAVAPEQALVINAAVYAVLLEGKGRLAAAGVHDVSFSETGYQPDPQLYPRTAYVPILTVTLQWTRRQTRRTGPVPNRATLLTPTFRMGDP